MTVPVSESVIFIANTYIGYHNIGYFAYRCTSGFFTVYFNYHFLSNILLRFLRTYFNITVLLFLFLSSGKELQMQSSKAFLAPSEKPNIHILLASELSPNETADLIYIIIVIYRAHGQLIIGTSGYATTHQSSICVERVHCIHPHDNNYYVHT